MREKIKHLGSEDDVRPLAKGEWPCGVARDFSDELAEVFKYDVDCNTYTVITRGSSGNPRQPGQRYLVDIPRKTESPGILAPLAPGTTVIINWKLGFPYIDGVLPVTANPMRNEKGPNKAAPLAGDGSSTKPPDNSVQPHGSGYYKEPGSPPDILQGDQVLFTSDGSRIGALRGNYAVMDAGPSCKAKREAIGTKDLLRDICENFELETGFGTIAVYNKQGHCSINIRGAADQLTQSGGQEKQWTFSLDIGDDGDYFDMKIMSPDGLMKSQMHLSSDGKVEILGTNGMSWVNGGKAPSYEESAGNVIKRFLAKLTTLVSGEIDEKFTSSRATAVSTNDSRIVGGMDSLSVNGNQLKNIGGNYQATIMGGLTANPLNIAVETQVLNGGYLLEVGNPRTSIPGIPHNYTVAVNNGNIVLGQNPALGALPAMRANVSLNAPPGSFVALGGLVPGAGLTNIALFHTVIWEQLITFLTQLMLMHDTHTHVPPVGGVPAIPMSSILNLMLGNFMSQRVLIGG